MAEIQCALSGQVEDLSLLNCDAYYGDIYFNKDVDGEIPTSGSLVDGCLVVKDTLLTDIEFIRSFNFNPSHKCKNDVDRFVVIVVLTGTYFILFSFTAICLKAYISMK
uniref:ZP domain-containing protein n=1 Tax=Angiostrongylus cantonensis TaxID=6313 RepID=A0A0K0DJJ4_ANGCA